MKSREKFSSIIEEKEKCLVWDYDLSIQDLPVLKP